MEEGGVRGPEGGAGRVPGAGVSPEDGGRGSRECWTYYLFQYFKKC